MVRAAGQARDRDAGRVDFDATLRCAEYADRISAKTSAILFTALDTSLFGARALKLLTYSET
jgi:hypothetical protein